MTGTADTRSRAQVTRSGRRVLRRLVPPQHGAWAMLLVPYAVGVLIAGPVPVHLPLLTAWLAGYLCSYFALLAIKTSRPRRFLLQLTGYGTVTAVSGLVVVIARPEVLVAAPVFAVLIGVNAWYARRQDERALASGLASVVMSCLMVPVAGLAAGVPLNLLADAFVAVLLYFTGTLLYVKTMIRERDDPVYLRASIAFHAVALAVATAVEVRLAPLFAALLLRATVLPRRRLAPMQVGLIELVAAITLIALLVLPGPAPG